MIYTPQAGEPLRQPKPDADPPIRSHTCEFCGRLPAFMWKGRLVCLSHASHVKRGSAAALRAAVTLA